MNDFQAFLDTSLSQINIMDTQPSEPIFPKQDIYREIREMIVIERKKQQMTQKQLSEKTGLSQANISNIEKGISRPTIESLIKISDAFGKQLAVYFVESEDNIL